MHALITALDHEGLIPLPPDCTIPADAALFNHPIGFDHELSPAVTPAISQITAQMHREITDHITAGTVPASVSTCGTFGAIST
ncbi:hypothetical protein ACWEQA_15075 [Nocardia sp. NPDC004085]